MKDGVDAMTKYMAKPPLTEGGFFENPHMIGEAVDKTMEKLVATPAIRTEILDVGVTRRYTGWQLDSFPSRVPNVLYYMHGDPGLTKDSFALALAHPLPEFKEITIEGGKKIKIPKVVVDFVLTWDPKVKVPVDLVNQEEVMKELIRYYQVRRVTFDRWNSANSIQDLVKMGVDADDMTFSNTEQFAMYRFLRLSIYNNMLVLPDDEKLVNELAFLKQKAGKIEHDLYGKDRADAVAAVVWQAAGMGYSMPRPVIGSGNDLALSPPQNWCPHPSMSALGCRCTSVIRSLLTGPYRAPRKSEFAVALRPVVSSLKWPAARARRMLRNGGPHLDLEADWTRRASSRSPRRPQRTASVDHI